MFWIIRFIFRAQQLKEKSRNFLPWWQVQRNGFTEKKVCCILIKVWKFVMAITFILILNKDFWIHCLCIRLCCKTYDNDRYLIVIGGVILQGQLISKCLFGVSNSPKKWTWKLKFLAKPSGAEIFRSFFGRIEKHKMSFQN